MQIYYNPKCSKCRETLRLIHENGKDAEIVDYLNHPPTPESLAHILKLLGIRPLDLVRKKEPLFIEKFRGKEFSDQEWLDILSKHPSLIERPVVIEGKKAVIGRPPEKVLELL